MLQLSDDVYVYPSDANSTEFNASTPHPVVVEMPEHHPGEMGGTMRLGKRKTLFHEDKKSVLSEWTHVSLPLHSSRHFLHLALQGNCTRTRSLLRKGTGIDTR